MKEIVFMYKEIMFDKIFKKKNRGDDKLVVALILVAIGVVLCVAYRNNISSVINTALDNLKDKLNSIISDASK